MSEPINDGGAAFPHEELVNNLYDDKGRITGSRVCHAHPGMTLRDWLAGQALAGMVHRVPLPYLKRAVVAQDCYDLADSMLEARKGGQP